MTEKLLHYIWQFQYFNHSSLITTSGEPITVVHPGRHNSNQGPDFQDAKIKIGDTLLAGSVELHLKTSDWTRHGHTLDANYNTTMFFKIVYQYWNCKIGFQHCCWNVMLR
jgi:hypothetical protein